LEDLGVESRETIAFGTSIDSRLFEEIEPQGKGEKKMKFKTLTAAAVLSLGVLSMTSGQAKAQDGILYKVQAGDTNYCHLKFPAIRPDTLHMDRPVLQSPSTGAIIDFYGPCDYDPTGKAAVQSQKRELRQRISREYNG
jgi:hypothetical protein